MDNRHLMSSNSNNSASHSLNQIETGLSSLSVNDSQQINHVTTFTNSTGSYSNMRVSPVQTSSLNPGAQEFVPRSQRGNTTMSHSRPTNHLSTTTSSQIPNHVQTISNGANNVSENYMEDFVALSYLKEFINHISNKPSMYEQGIQDLTFIINSFLDEDDCVLELIVNQIVDQSIIDGNFRYNGVRLCHHLIQHLRPTKSGQSFKEILFKRCQRECSRTVHEYSQENTFVHLRGLALFTAELYLECKAPELAEHLPNLLQIILSSNINVDANVKCACQTLKLCGQQLDHYFRTQNKNDALDEVVKKLKDSLNHKLSDYIVTMANSAIKLAERKWGDEPHVSTNTNNATSVANSELNNQPYYNNYYQSYDEYDFGDCGDECNAEVCQDFENFLKNIPQ